MFPRLAIICACLAASLHASAQMAQIKPSPGIVLTSTIHTAFLSVQDETAHAYPMMDMEFLVWIESVTPDNITYKIHLSSTTDKHANEDVGKFNLIRHVRTEDLQQSGRMTLFYSTVDPETYAGQTFAETSSKTLNLLKTAGETPFVLGVLDNNDIFAPLAPLLGGAPLPLPAAASMKGAPLSPASLASYMIMLGMGRTYYRGVLHRAEPSPTTVSVLVNGVRTGLAAIHASGSFTFGSKPAQSAEFWWLDDPAYPLTLRWKFGQSTLVVTKIDLPDATGSASESRNSVHGGSVSTLATQLAGKACQAELPGIYFNTGSAEILDVSTPMLKSVAAVIKEVQEPKLTIGGHTDNIGSAEYNQDLSEKRAAAVRDALVSRYGVPAARLTAKGYGLTRPVETNDTEEGRAHNRRVELSRPCAIGR